MKKIVSILFLILILFATPAHSTSVFLTSDNFINEDVDLKILNSIKEYIETIDNSINVNIDSVAPSPSEATRVALSDEDTSITLAAACAGNFLELATYALRTNKHIIYVNIGDFDIDNEPLRRAWDDNFSDESFAGISKPGEFLNHAGVTTIQPLQEFPEEGSNGFINGNNEKINEYIATEAVKSINSYDFEKEKVFDTSLINYHKISPKIMASSSSELLKNGTIDSNMKYNSFSPEQLLYLTSTYLGSDGIDMPKEYGAPDSPLKYSLFTKDSYSIGEYMEMGFIVKEYMDENEKAPSYIFYKGAIISYYDLVYNFAIITENHTSASNMDFNRNYEFKKYNDSILINFIPIILIIFFLLVVFMVIKNNPLKKLKK